MCAWDTGCTYPEMVGFDAPDGPQGQFVDAHFNRVLSWSGGPRRGSRLLTQKHLQAEVVVDDGDAVQKEMKQESMKMETGTCDGPRISAMVCDTHPSLVSMASNSTMSAPILAAVANDTNVFS